MCRACGVRACTGRRAAAGLVPAGGPAAELTGRAWRVWARAQVLEQLAAESLSPTACTTIEEVGSTGVGALTIAFLILGVSTIVFISRVGSAKGQKVYYYCNVFVCGFATMAYFAMLSGQGWTAIAGCRQFFYARYVDWSITTPLLLLDLGLIAGADGALIAAVIGADRKFCSCVRAFRLPSLAGVRTGLVWFFGGSSFSLPLLRSARGVHLVAWAALSKQGGCGTDILRTRGHEQGTIHYALSLGRWRWLASEAQEAAANREAGDLHSQNLDGKREGVEVCRTRGMCRARGLSDM